MTDGPKPRSSVEKAGGDPIFVHELGAVKFALNFRHGTLQKNVLAQFMGSSGRGRGLAGLDGAGQAAMIRNELERLEPLHRNMLIARHAVPSIPCDCLRACCRGWTDNPEWADAVAYLAEEILVRMLTGSISHFRLRRAMVRRFFGHKASFAAIADECKVHRNTASLYYKKVSEFFKVEDRLAKWAIEGYLKDAGVIE